MLITLKTTVEHKECVGGRYDIEMLRKLPLC